MAVFIAVSTRIRVRISLRHAVLRVMANVSASPFMSMSDSEVVINVKGSIPFTEFSDERSH